VGAAAMNKLERASLYASNDAGAPVREEGLERCVQCDMPNDKCKRSFSSCCDGCWHPGRIKLRETPPHALSRPDAVREIEHRQELEHRLSKLTDEERAVLELHGQGEYRVVEVRYTLEEVEACRDDIHTLKIGELDRGFRTVTRRLRMKLTYEEIGERLHLSARQVHRRLSSANAKLRGR